MCESVQRQLQAFVQFILADPRLLKALQNKDWPTFARIYNGPAYAKYDYDIKVANAYAKRSKGK
jgi:N-acetylmuramidase